MNKYSPPFTPLPEPLSGSVSGSFAHNTITQRLPKILRQTLTDNEFPPQIMQKFESLLEDIPSASLTEIIDPGSPDVDDWQRYIAPYLGKNWLQAPWFFVEMYFYRRILAATGFHQSGVLGGYDPFIKQKQLALESASDSISKLGEQLTQALESWKSGLENQQADLKQLLVLNVWGNQADLSMWSADENRPDHQDMVSQLAHLLVDDSDQVFEYLDSIHQGPKWVDFVLDNYGPELVHDLALADYLLSTGMVSGIRFHAKPTPHYVSDAMIKDIHSTLAYLAGSSEESVREFAQRVNEHLQAGHLDLKEDYFWTSPRFFWDMPDYLHQELSNSVLVISKGDANYRRLAGDRDWPPTTPFQEVMRYFPSPLLALRVHKAELALGLSPQQVLELDDQDPEWRFNGNWAVIQFKEP
jgi:uncharacterized protein with ATP-grasp and redox domains